MTFERHLFISYAHIDNQPLTPEQQGWVTRFHSSLQAMLSMRIGRKAEIWRDQKICRVEDGREHWRFERRPVSHRRVAPGNLPSRPGEFRPEPLTDSGHGRDRTRTR